jgi:hypothetical protein
MTDCFWGSTTRPFIWKPFIRFAVLPAEANFRKVLEKELAKYWQFLPKIKQSNNRNFGFEESLSDFLSEKWPKSLKIVIKALSLVLRCFLFVCPTKA